MKETDTTLEQELKAEIAELLGCENGKPPPRLDKHQFSTVFGITPETSDVWASVGRYSIPYFKLGRNRYYSLADVIRALVRFRHAPTDQAA